MSKFNRENRYIVIKRSDLANVPVNYRAALVDPLNHLQAHLPRRECLVIESDWPEYEIAWRRIEARVTGAQPAEAEGAVPVICYLRATPDGTPEWSEDCVCEDAVYPNYDGDETVSMPLVRQSDRLAALSAVTAERDALREQVKALQSDANSWQPDAFEVARHSKRLVEQLRAENTRLKAECEQLSETVMGQEGVIKALEPDARRYRNLRQMHWNDGPLAVVAYPKANVKLGADCLSGERLDQMLDQIDEQRYPR